MIGRDGAVIINELSIDGHGGGRYRVVTHAHSDHTVNLGKSINNNMKLIATPLTINWLKVLGHKIPNPLIIEVNYGDEFRLGDTVFKFIKSVHIPGTFQVRAELPSGEVVVYTSDFKRPGDETPIINSDYLVIDAVYGNPSFVREFDDYINEVLVDLVKELLSKGPVYIYGYYGKIQEVMQLLRDYGIDAPYLVTPKHYRLCKVAEVYGMRFGDYVLSGTPEADDIVRDGWFIFFSHISRRFNGVVGNHIVLSGWEFRRPFRRLGSRRWLVAFSDHSDFRGLVKYVEESGAKEVIINTVRSTGAEEFREYVVRKLGVKAYLLP